MVLFTCWYQETLNYPIPSLFTVPQIKKNPIYRFIWLFLWCWKVSGLKKDLLQEGHTNSTPKCTLHTCTQMVTHEVDGPSLQPSTWHLYTHLMPPAECEGVAYWQGSPPLKLGAQLERQTPLHVLQDQRLQVLWTPEGADGGWWWMGYGKLSCGEVRLRMWRGVTPLPSEPIKTLCLWACHCYFHLPQPLSFQVLGFHFYHVGLLPQGTGPFQQDQPLKDKRKEKYRGKNIKRNRKPYKKRANPPPARAPMPPPQYGQETPTCIQLQSTSMSSSSFIWGLGISSSADLSAKKKKPKLQMSNDMLKKCMHING